MRSEEERKFENKLIKNALRAHKNELYEIYRVHGYKEMLKLENQIRAAVRKKSGAIFKRKKSIENKPVEMGGIYWENDNGIYKGSVDKKVLFEIKKGMTIYNLYHNKKYISCGTEMEKLMKRANDILIASS
jgi:hypothetical protein